MSAKLQPIRVCLLAFDMMDLMDFGGPLETLSHARNESRHRLFSVQVAASTPEINTVQGLVIHRDTTWDEAQNSLETYDVLVVPGSNYATTVEHCKPEDPIIRLIEQFSALPARAAASPRVLLSICSASFFLATAGILAGRRATTHYFILKPLEAHCENHGRTEVVRKRFVDAGLLPNGARVVTSGGITSGFDATLYVVELLAGTSCAEKASNAMDYPWNKLEGLF
ncbi:uncharacterized protein N7459_009285 [Penicillium hispanicum]|uniref:uncharacterized protein n=1 Tax=Penicillium hispanicum TaxID=1080232 RepID=UPI002541DD9B|nr:uncharacterized protein N7459_009285 [Penicillium hispanicum]KAJ5569855.1 hypothetical protein N7459_009285 [Penicillium hispanicum]